jgi:hypothetical protein
VQVGYISVIQGNSKLFSGVLFIGHGNPDNNLESPCITQTDLSCWLQARVLDTDATELVHIDIFYAPFGEEIKPSRAS